MFEVTEKNFDEVVVDAKELTIVDFWADWCGPCKMMAPVLESVDQKYDQVKVCKLNVDQNSSLAREYNVMSIPTMIFFKDGVKIHQVIGFHSQEELEAEIQPYLD